MEKKLIALVLIALIGGLGGGYGLNYVIYQPQIQNLHDDMNALNDRFDTINTTLRSTQTSLSSLEDESDMLNSEVTSLNSTVETIENRTWHEVYSIGASSDIVSGIFQLKGKEIKISWMAVSANTDGWLEIDLCFSNGTLYGIWGSSGVYACIDADLFLIQAGDYYLEIYTYLTDYAVMLYDYY